MKTQIRYIYTAILALVFSSCHVHKELAVIKTGGREYERVNYDYNKITPTNGETYLTYNKKNERIQSESNIINFNVQSRKYPGSFYKAPEEKFPYATFSKMFYYSNFWTALKPLYSIFGVAGVASGIVGIVPTFGQSLLTIPYSIDIIDFRPYGFTGLKEYKCKRENCIDRVVNAKVLLSVKLVCKKNQSMNDTLTIIDKLPEGAKLSSYKVVSGNRKLSNVIHDSYSKDGVEYHTYKLVGKDNKFSKKRTKIEIKQYISYTFKEKYFTSR